MRLDFFGKIINLPEFEEFYIETLLFSFASTLHYIAVLAGCMTRFIYSFVSDPSPRYKWKEDVVQDARVLFGFRVLATCLDTFPVSHFLNHIAPTMFLYP